MKKPLLAALTLPLLVSAAIAQPSEDDILLMAASQKAVEIYRDSGVAGMGVAVDDCASGLSRVSAAEDVEFCVALNLAAMHVDDMTTRAQSIPRDNQFKEGYVFAQTEELLKFFAPTEHQGQLTPYLQERSAKIANYVAIAANTPQSVQHAQQEAADAQSVAEAFATFWQSTDCNEMRSISQWDELIAVLKTTDQQLCATFVQMHQQVQGVQVTNVQSLPGARARVTATLSLRQQSMQQQDTFVLVNGKWLLAGRNN
ncbi:MULTISPECIES: hypothetical protein [Pseudomonas]|uniref:hypothetical protein n=1 Tax=Pseudomonas TaxID=286 RepID=UPI0018A5475E|nr:MULTISPECIES: hypothetical protein [Pseudomonas]MDM9594729.1 hypothetical protein [Pseudomonas guariconensis]MDM9607560.1 hypothetical protein [Pseudomonas guariconensis]MDM9612517.1 hypothetical protein [Pseudomonas guariconensis]BBV97890.1 hypothetical protein STW0522PSE72_32410 [Pseudomonas monteilii]